MTAAAEAEQHTWCRQRRSTEELVELGQVGDHFGFLQLFTIAQLLHRRKRLNPKLLLADVKSQLEVYSMILLI